MKCFQQGPCALRDQPCLSLTLDHLWPGSLGSLRMICEAEGLLYWPQIKKLGEDLCAAINFYTSNKPQVTDYTFRSLISSLDQTWADMRPLQTSPNSPAADSSELQRKNAHTPPSLCENISAVSMHSIAAAFQDIHDIPPVKMKLMVGARQKESYHSSRVITAADQKQSQLLQGHMCGPGLREKTLWHKAIGGNQNIIQNKRMSNIFYLESNVSKLPLPADNHPANPRHKTDLRISSRTLSWHLFTSEELLWRYRGRWSNLTICFLSARLYFLNFLIYLSKG